MPQCSTIEVISPAPVVNIPDFHLVFGGIDGRAIPKNSLGHPKHFEFVALTGQQFGVEEIFSRHDHCIYRISSPVYPSLDLFLDSRFTRASSENSLEIPSLPKKEELAEKMKSLLGTNYIWGGNWSAGIEKLLHFYPPRGAIDEETRRLWTLQGVDCSGLLYEAARGSTPRNTSQLVYFGKSLPIQGKRAEEIAELLLPMDMVVWLGHVWFVLDQKFAIESKSPFGVIRRPLLERLEETCRERQGMNHWSVDVDPDRSFVIRRF